MLVVESAMAGARKEVALAAIGVITTVVGAHGAGPAMTRAMWKRALRAMGVGVEAAVSPNCMVPLMARLELVSAIGQLHVRCPASDPCSEDCTCPPVNMTIGNYLRKEIAHWDRAAGGHKLFLEACQSEGLGVTAGDTAHSDGGG